MSRKVSHFCAPLVPHEDRLIGTPDRVKLTVARVEALPITGKRYDVHDTVVPELHVRVPATSTGRKVYAVRLRVRGTNRFKRVTLGPASRMTPEEARTRAREILAQLARGEDPRKKTLKVEELLMRDLFEAWYANHATVRLRPRTAREAKRIWEKYWQPRLGNRRVGEVTPELVATVFADIARTSGDVMANRCKAWLSALFGYARRTGYMGGNPCSFVQKTREVPRQRYLNEVELAKLLAWCLEHSPGPGDGILLLLLTGVRVSTLRQGDYSQVDELGTWRIPAEKMKAGKPLDLPLPRQVLELLRQRQRLALPWPRFSEKGWDKARQELQLQDVHAHDLRRTLAVVLNKLGCPSLTIAAILGHSAPRELLVTRIYAVTTIESMGTWLQRAADHMFAMEKDAAIGEKIKAQ